MTEQREQPTGRPGQIRRMLSDLPFSFPTPVLLPPNPFAFPGFPFPFFHPRGPHHRPEAGSFIHQSLFGRVVKAFDSRSNSPCERRFDPDSRQIQFFVFCCKRLLSFTRALLLPSSSTSSLSSPFLFSFASSSPSFASARCGTDTTHNYKMVDHCLAFPQTPRKSKST